MRIVLDHKFHTLIARVPNVLMLDPVAVALELCDRPTTIHGKWLWPKRRLLELVAQVGGIPFVSAPRFDGLLPSANQ